MIALAVGMISLEHHREPSGVCAYHKKRSHDPVHENAEADLDPDRPLAEHAMQGLVLDFAQDGIHHHQQAHS